MQERVFQRLPAKDAEKLHGSRKLGPFYTVMMDKNFFPVSNKQSPSVMPN